MCECFNAYWILLFTQFSILVLIRYDYDFLNDTVQVLYLGFAVTITLLYIVISICVRIADNFIKFIWIILCVSNQMCLILIFFLIPIWSSIFPPICIHISFCFMFIVYKCFIKPSIKDEPRIIFTNTTIEGVEAYEAEGVYNQQHQPTIVINFPTEQSSAIIEPSTLPPSYEDVIKSDSKIRAWSKLDKPPSYSDALKIEKL